MYPRGASSWNAVGVVLDDDVGADAFPDLGLLFINGSRFRAELWRVGASTFPCPNSIFTRYSLTFLHFLAVHCTHLTNNISLKFCYYSWIVGKFL